MNIRDLSRKLGLSKTTVANSLSGKGRVGTDTRELVRRAAERLGYKTNAVASTFYRQIRSKGPVRHRANLAILFPPHAKYLSLLCDGIYRRTAELGYSIDTLNLEEYEPRRLNSVLAARGIMGIFVFPLFSSVGHITLDWSQIAAVAFGYSMARPAIHRVVHHHAHGMRMAFAKCRREGRHRIGLVLDKTSNARSNGMWASCFLGLQAALPKSEQVSPLMLPQGELTSAAVNKWVRREKPDAIIFHYGPRIPKIDKISGGTIPAVVLDRLPQDIYPGVDQQYGACGEEMVNLLSQLILHNTYGIPARPTISMIDGVWMDGAT